jgi:hypothetical protein
MDCAIHRIFRLVVLASALVAPAALVRSAYGWGDDGHEIVAYIAQDNLTAAAHAQVAAILEVSDQPEKVAAAMAAASILPDTEFRQRDRNTAPWHYIDLCLQDNRAEIAARCAGGQCVTAKIDEYAERLRTARYDGWGARGDLAFLIHFVGDIYQPLHAATNADEGGNCILVDVNPPVKSLHILWDVTLVRALEDRLDSGDPRLTARLLEQKYRADHAPMVWTSATPDQIAWRSLQTARTQIYARLRLPVKPCAPDLSSCQEAPKTPVKITPAYINQESMVAGHQLALAGFALADLLNRIWQ